MLGKFSLTNVDVNVASEQCSWPIVTSSQTEELMSLINALKIVRHFLFPSLCRKFSH